MISFKDFVKNKAPEINEASNKKIATQLISQIKVNLSSIDFVFLNTEYKLNLDTAILSILHEGGKKIQKVKLTSLPKDLKTLKGDELSKELIKILQSQVGLSDIEIVSKGSPDTAFILSLNYYGINCIISLRDKEGFLNVNAKENSSSKRHINISSENKIYEVKDYFLLKNKIEDKHKNIIEACITELLSKFH